MTAADELSEYAEDGAEILTESGKTYYTIVKSFADAEDFTGYTKAVLDKDIDAAAEAYGGEDVFYDEVVEEAAEYWTGDVKDNKVFQQIEQLYDALQ